MTGRAQIAGRTVFLFSQVRKSEGIWESIVTIFRISLSSEVLFLLFMPRKSSRS